MKRTPIRRVSTKRAAQMREYSKKRTAFLAEHSTCAVCKQASATEVHHREGRGKNYLRVETFMPVCRQCHRDRIHGDPKTARANGWLA